MYEANILSVLPPVLAIILAIDAPGHYFLTIGIWIGFCLLESVNPLTGLALAVDGIINVFSDAGDTRVLVFTLVIGGLIATIEKAGGVRGFIHLLENRQWVDRPSRAQWLAYLTGVVIFIESNITLLVAGSISRPLFDRYKLAREKAGLHYRFHVRAYLHSDSPQRLGRGGHWPVGIRQCCESGGCIYLGDHLQLLRCWLAIALAALVIWKGIDVGPMRKAQARTEAGEFLWPDATPMVDPSILADEAMEASADDRARFMIIPIAVMVAAMPIALYITGDGVMSNGSGSTSVLWCLLRWAQPGFWCCGTNGRGLMS